MLVEWGVMRRWDLKESIKIAKVAIILLKWNSGGAVVESACQCRRPGDSGLVPGLGRSLEEGMATHFSILAWKTPWTGEPGGLQSMGVVKSQTRLSPHTQVVIELQLIASIWFQNHLLPVVSLFSSYIYYIYVSDLLLGTNGSFFLDDLHVQFSPGFCHWWWQQTPSPIFLHILSLPSTRASLYFSFSIPYLILEAQLNPHFLLEYSLYVLELSGPLRNPIAVAHQWLMKRSAKHLGSNLSSILPRGMRLGKQCKVFGISMPSTVWWEQ